MAENNSNIGQYYDGEGYINFNQFVSQHNLSQYYPPQHQFDMSVPVFSNQVQFAEDFVYNNSNYPVFPSIEGFDQAHIVQASNLVPTALEFVPRNNVSESSFVCDQYLPDQKEDDVRQEVNSSSNTNPRKTGAVKKNSHQNNNDFSNHVGHENGRNFGSGRHDRRNMRRRDDGFNHNKSFNSNENVYRGRKMEEGFVAVPKRQNEGDKRENWRKNVMSSKLGQNEEFSERGHVSPHIQFKADRNLKKHCESVNTEKYSQREKLIQEIDSGKLECLVCCEKIKPFHSTWSCLNCHHIFHLNCTIKWAASSKSEDGWRCPACQNVTKSVPRDYYCFCGKLLNPAYNRNDVAHSCGELCSKSDVCMHPCTLLCHPGPCPPCQANVTRECGCGKKKSVVQCSVKTDLKCDEICGKTLNCGIHFCKSKCHLNECDSCKHTVHHQCFCGKENKEEDCTIENNKTVNFSCGKICNNHLKCKNHFCRDICHPRECHACPNMPEVVTSCPCGKAPILPGDRKVCTDPITVCGGVCGRQLKCGQPSAPHRCSSRCHIGNCPPCNRETAVKCRCGHMDQMIKCKLLSTRADDARCKKRCTKRRNCGKHKCNQDCCIDIEHLCPISCNFTLSCGKHKCNQTCHKGKCLPCYRTSFDELHCECGAEVIYPPVPCGTKKPTCERPCSRNHLCSHPAQHNCHSSSSCPPCMAFTTKYCHGKHEQRKTIPCAQESFSCGLPCNKSLRCGRHKCIRICHENVCEQTDDVCKQSCNKQRISCTHKCAAPCHDTDCPDIPCRELVEVSCVCGNRKQTRTCHDFSRDYRRIATAQLASSMQEMQNGGSVELKDIFGPIKNCNTKTLECNDECQVIQRTKRMAIALQIRNPDNASKFHPKYSEFIRSWAKKDPALVTMIYEKLTELVKLAKESKQKSRSHSFPVMKRDKRQLVHELCEMFGVDSEAYDAEPNRNVVATAQRDRSWLPSMSVMGMLARESGQRRIPIPNNNAWNLKK